MAFFIFAPILIFSFIVVAAVPGALVFAFKNQKRARLWQRIYLLVSLFAVVVVTYLLLPTSGLIQRGRFSVEDFFVLPFLDTLALAWLIGLLSVVIRKPTLSAAPSTLQRKSKGYWKLRQ